MPSSEPSASTQPRAASGAGLEASPTPGDAARLLGLELRPRRRPAARVAIALAVLVVVVVLGGLFMKRRAAAGLSMQMKSHWITA